MARSATGNRDAQNSSGAVIAPPVQVVHVSEPGRRLRLLGALAGIAGPVLLAAYFAAPALTRWPYAGASPAKLTAYATAHRLLFTAAGGCRPPGRC